MKIENNEISIQIAKRRWLRRLGVFKIPSEGKISYRGHEFFVFLEDWRGPSYHFINWGLDSYEPEVFKLILQNVPEGGTYLDIGANVGVFPFRLSLERNKKVRILAFEPEDGANACLQKTVAQNHMENVKIFKSALSSSNGEMTFYVDAENHGGNSLNKQAIISDQDTIKKEVKIQTRTLDSVVSAEGLKKIDLIKIDVQRHEYDVLSGARETLKNLRPKIMMECYHQDLIGDRSLLNFFDEGYIVFDHVKNESATISDFRKKFTMGADPQAYSDLLFLPS